MTSVFVRLKFVRSGFAAALLAATSSAAAAEAPTWRVDPATSYIEFAGAQTGNAFTGRFNAFTAEIAFDPNDLAGSSIVAEIQMDSAKTGDRQRDSALPGKDWFDAKSHPAARFVSSEIAAAGEGAYEAKGQLTIRDVTRDVVLPFTLEIDGDNAHAEGALQIIRSDYQVGQGEFADGRWVALEVGVDVVIDATRE